MAHKLNRKKFSTYLAQDVIQAIRRLAACKDVSMNVVIEAALRKCIPTKYYKEE